MSNPHQLRAGGSGPVFDGNADDVLTLLADGTAKFLPPSGGGGSVPPLTIEFWVDQGRAGSTQDGSIANPYLAIQNGIDAIEGSGAGAGSLMVADGDYSAEELVCSMDIAIVASTRPITVAKLGNSGAPVPGVRLYNVRVTGESWLIGGTAPTRVEGGGLLGDVEMTGEPRLDGINADFGNVRCTDVLGALTFKGCTVKKIFGSEGGFRPDSVQCWDTQITEGGIDCENAFMYVCDVAGGLTANRATLEQTAVLDGLNVSNTLTADTFSLQAARAGLVGTNPLPLLTNVTDHRCTFGILVVPAIEQGSFADVNIGAPGLFAREGDVVVVNMANPQLANVGIANAWINADGSGTVRFFGTTAGGNQTYNLALIQTTP